MSVSEWAEAHRVLKNPGGYSGPWRNSITPYLVDPMDRSASRAVDVLILAGPSQFAKTEMGLNIIGHAVQCRPRDMLAVQYSREMAIDFFNSRIQKKLIDPSPALKARVGRHRGDAKVMEKSFTTGMRVVAGWPVAGQLAARPVPIFWADEVDRMPRDIGGEGDVVELGRKRTTTFGRNALTLVTSSPSGLHPDDADHDSDAASAILLWYMRGDQNLWHWQCIDCREYWTPGFGEDRRPTTKHLHIPEGLTPEQARDAAHLVCPECGVEVLERHKTEMNATGLWLPVGMTITAKGKIVGARPANRIASYWFPGFASPFRSIGEIAEELTAAEAVYDKTQDETKLKTCYNTALGFPFRTRAGGRLPIEVEALEGRRESYALGTVPEGVRFLTSAVDVGVHKFDVAVNGWGADGESWLIDRFTLTAAPDGADLDPANTAAHWELLTGAVLNKAYPLAADPGLVLMPATTAIDTGGAAGSDDEGDPTEGVAEQARNYVRRLFAADVERWRIMPIKGAAAKTAPMLPRAPTWETDDNGKRRAGAVGVFGIGVHALKNVIDTRLRKEKKGPGYKHYPQTVPAGYFEELTAERKKKGAWKKTAANESWDLEVYTEAARQRLRTDRIDWDNPPDWATPKPPADIVAAQQPRAVAKKRRVRSKGI